jgi:hypothetical protein
MKYLNAGEQYIAIEDGLKGYRAIPKKCNCNKFVTVKMADWLVETGQALLVWKKKNRLVYEDETCVWSAQARQVPRVDLISRADIERAYTGDDPKKMKESIDYIEMVHQLYEENRMLLMAPFRPDPWEGRCLFTFSTEQRTAGGHSGNK